MKNRKNLCCFAEKMPHFCVRMPCERCVIGKVYDLRRRVPKDGVHRYKNYVLIQSSDGPYYIFDNRTEKWVVHAECTRPLTRREAREHICFYIKNKR